MKKTIFILLMLISSSVFSQTICQWAYIPTGPTQTYNSISQTTVDHSGNIIQVGRILGVADMDPGSGPGDTAFTIPSYNYYVSKTSMTGNLIWLKNFSSQTQISSFDFIGLDVSSQNDIIITGNFFGLVDFDLSASGVDTLRSHFPTYTDYFVAKYDSMGNYKWAFNIGNPTTSDVVAKFSTVLDNDNIIVAANPNGAVDVDPSLNINNSIGSNANVICYDADGNYVWNNHTSTLSSQSIRARSLASDGIGNVYLVSVGYYEMTVSKFDTAGVELWSKKIGNFSSNGRVTPQSIIADSATSEFYVAGTFGGSVDFDPGAGSLFYSSSSGFFQDGFIAKYDQNMNPIWVKVYAGNINFGISSSNLGSSSFDFDGSDLIVAGSLTGTINFGNNLIFSSPGSVKPFYVKLNSNGISQNGFMLSSPGNFYFLSKSSNQSFVVAGNISSNTDMDPSSGSLILNTPVSNFFTAVYQTTSTTSIENLESGSKLSVFPNPSIGNFTVSYESGLTEISVFNSLGQEVLNKQIHGDNVDFNLNEKGLYLLLVKTNDKKYTRRIIVN